MIFEDQYGVGDVVDLGEAGGTVEAVGLRVTRLRDVEGTVWYVRNGEIIRVGNQSQNWARTVLDIPVALDQDLRRVQEVLRDVAHDLWDDEDFKHVDHRGAGGLGRRRTSPRTGSPSGSSSRPPRSSSGPWPARCASGSSSASTTRASSSPTRPAATWGQPA